MKKLGKLKLNVLNDRHLENKEMKNLLGGLSCGCGCQGSSSNDDNEESNYKNGYQSGSSSCDCMP